MVPVEPNNTDILTNMKQFFQLVEVPEHLVNKNKPYVVVDERVVHCINEVAQRLLDTARLKDKLEHQLNELEKVGSAILRDVAKDKITQDAKNRICEIWLGDII